MSDEIAESAFRPEELGFPVVDDGLQDEVERSELALERLISQPHHPFQRLFDFTSACVPIGRPPIESLSPRIRLPAERLGFEPVARVFSGTVPALFHYVPIFADRTGLAILSIYGFGNRWYLHTYFDDGTAISTSPRSSGNARTEAYVAPDLETGYEKHMKVVRSAMESRGVRPIVRNTPKLLRMGWSVYRLNYVSPVQALILTLAGFFILTMAGSLAWMILSRFIG